MLSDQPEDEEGGAGAGDAEAEGGAATTPGGRPAPVPAMADVPAPESQSPPPHRLPAHQPRSDARAAAAISRDIEELEALEMELGEGEERGECLSGCICVC